MAAVAPKPTPRPQMASTTTIWKRRACNCCRRRHRAIKIMDYHHPHLHRRQVSSRSYALISCLWQHFPMMIQTANNQHQHQSQMKQKQGINQSGAGPIRPNHLLHSGMYHRPNCSLSPIDQHTRHIHHIPTFPRRESIGTNRLVPACHAPMKIVAASVLSVLVVEEETRVPNHEKAVRIDWAT